MSDAPIHHSVFFDLKHEPGSPAERSFLERLEALSSIPGVEAMRTVREVSPRNTYRFGALMEFADQAAYDAYNRHPDHVRFVEEVFVPGVSDFQEIDWVER
jgi:hypothetical protein